MTKKTDVLRDALVDTLISVIKEQQTETPASILSVARSYLRDLPPEDDLMLAHNKSVVLKEFLNQLPFDDEPTN